MINDAAYWISFAHMPQWRHARMNEIIIRFFHDRKLTIEDFFNLSEEEWRSGYNMNEKEISDLLEAKSQVANNSFVAENLYNEGYEIIPITDPEYSKTLKANLKVQHSPAALYIKGNKKILGEKSIAIVGSRDAGELSLSFTDNIAKLASREYKVVVSGFARGVDKQALDSAIKYNGQSIIVLPQGVSTFTSGYKTYYKQIIEGNVLVLSIFHPKAPWRTELAMARNPIIYGLASEIYVAETSEKGGTWSGVTDGLRKNRTIYVRMPDQGERNANKLLIEKGAIAVDFNGNPVKGEYSIKVTEPKIVNEPIPDNELKLKAILGNKALSIKEIMEKDNFGMSQKMLTNYLKKIPAIEQIKKSGKNYYRLKSYNATSELKLF